MLHNLLQRLRGLFGVGITWGTIWAVFGGAAGLARGPEQERHALLPLVVAELGVLEQLPRGRRSALRRLQGARVGLARAIPVVLIPEHVAELAEQGARRRPARVLELQLVQLLHHVELAELPVDRTRLGERLDERRVLLEGVLEVLQGLDALEEPIVEQAPELEVVARESGGLGRPRDRLLERFLQPVPVVVSLEMIEALL